MAQASSSTSWERPGRSPLGTFLDSLLSFFATLLHPAIVFFSAMAGKKNRPRHRHKTNNNGGAAGPQSDDPEKVNNMNSAQSPSSASAAGITTTANMNGHASTSTPTTATTTSAAGAEGGSATLRKENGAPVRETSVLDEQIIAGVAGLNVSNDENVKEQQQQQNGHITTISSRSTGGASSIIDENEDPVKAEYRRVHQGFMDEALDMARLALKTNETPVGCVLVYEGRVIARGMNATNVTRNGTRHAELMAICALTSYTKEKDLEKPSKKRGKKNAKSSDKAEAKPEPTWGDVDPKDGHLYPYGQKLHPAPRVDRSIISQCILYVTVEPCVMCASMLRQYGIKKVFFGAVNDKFGGTGGVFNIHMNAGTVSAPQSPSLRPPSSNKPPRAPLARLPASSNASTTATDRTPAGEGDSGDARRNNLAEYRVALPMRIGDGGNVEPGYEVEGGWGRDEAVNLLRQFYVQENGRAPVPRKKEGRAARLAAMMERDGMSVEGTGLLDDAASGNGTPAADDGTTSTPTNGSTEENNNVQSGGDASSDVPEPVTLASTSDAKA